MAVIHKGVDKIIDSNNNEVVISTASTTINAVNDATTGLASKASTNDLNTGLGAKLDATATAANASKLGNNAPSHYATATDLTNGLNGKLDATAQAVDSVKLAGQASSYYVATTGLSATTDGTDALGWDGTKFKKVPVGSDSVTSATKWTTARTISLGGDATGSVSIDGTANKTLTVTVANDSHTHDGRYYTESEINTKLTTLETDIKNDLLGGAGAAYDTLKELETALTSNDSEIAALTTTIGTKLGKTEKAADSDKLDGLNSTQFLRSDATDSFTTLSGTQITLGAGVKLKESGHRADLLCVESQTSSWAGIQIDNTSNESVWNYMVDGETAGLYDDTNNKWSILTVSNSYVKLNYNGGTKFETLNNGAKVHGDFWVSGGDLVLEGTGRIQGIDTVSAGTDAANKTYVDNAVASGGGGGIPQLTRTDTDATYTDYTFA